MRQYFALRHIAVEKASQKVVKLQFLAGMYQLSQPNTVMFDCSWCLFCFEEEVRLDTLQQSFPTNISIMLKIPQEGHRRLERNEAQKNK